MRVEGTQTISTVMPNGLASDHPRFTKSRWQRPVSRVALWKEFVDGLVPSHRNIGSSRLCWAGSGVLTAAKALSSTKEPKEPMQRASRSTHRVASIV